MLGDSHTHNSPSTVTANIRIESDSAHTSTAITPMPSTIGGARRRPLSNARRCNVPSVQPTAHRPPLLVMCMCWLREEEEEEDGKEEEEGK